MCYVLFFFFFKQKTAYEMRISDWSLDVCSSDLQGRAIADVEEREGLQIEIDVDGLRRRAGAALGDGEDDVEALHGIDGADDHRDHKIGRASCRERVCQYV